MFRDVEKKLRSASAAARSAVESSRQLSPLPLSSAQADRSSRIHEAALSWRSALSSMPRSILTANAEDAVSILERA